MSAPRFEIAHTPLGFVVRTIHPDHPNHKWASRPWREHKSALQTIFLMTGNKPVPAPAGSGWSRGVDWGRWGFCEVRETADEPPVRPPARLGRPPRSVYQ